MESYEFCELKNEKDIIEHERLLYDAFINRAPEGWIYNNYERINNCRLKAPYDYNKQIILGIKKNGELKLSLAISTDVLKPMQLEYIGFTRHRINKSKKFAEGLTLCTTGEPVPKYFFDLFEKFNNFISDEIKKNKIEAIYGTAIKKLKIFYLRMGFKVVDQIITEHGPELLLEKCF